MKRVVPIGATIVGLLVVVGVVWGFGAAVLLAYPMCLAGLVTVWAVLAGRLDQRAAAWYYQRQLTGNPSGRWRDRSR
jgi:hypothetical protein